MTFEELKNKIDEAINGVWFDYQTSLGIEYGDCDPMTVFEYDEAVDKIAKLIERNETEKLPRHGHKRFCVVFDCETASFVDGMECDTEEEAHDIMAQVYDGWIDSFCDEYGFRGLGIPTEEQRKAWNNMIDMDCCYYVEWDDDIDEYEDDYYCRSLSDDELKAIGWEAV